MSADWGIVAPVGTSLAWEYDMKGVEKKKETRKKAQKSLKEKRAEKHAKKEARV